MRVTRTAVITTSGVPAPPWILEYWWLIAGAGILGLIVVGAVAYQESERQKLLASAR